MQMVREVFVDGRHWVVRAQPHGVSVRNDLWSRGFNLERRLVRWLRRDRRWVLSARSAANDPWGPPELERTIESRSQVPAGMDEMVRKLEGDSLLHD